LLSHLLISGRDYQHRTEQNHRDGGYPSDTRQSADRMAEVDKVIDRVTNRRLGSAQKN
jgi:hypothetical protein